ncbi:MAG: hypothetical protein J6X27_07885 [Bacteroidaceae bacterium]|nr:hypothetical protein [Bacteroidaceae bacterium]
MNKKEYHTPEAGAIKMQQRVMQGPSQSGHPGQGESHKFNGGVVDDDEEESTL